MLKKLKIFYPLVPVLLGFLLFLATKSKVVEAVAQASISKFLLEKVIVSTEKGTNGYSQINFSIQDQKSTITKDAYPHADPSSEGENVVWMAQIDGLWQIFLFNLPTGETVQLTFSGNNVNPDIYDNYVAWEGQTDGVWQIFMFDGLRINQITSGEKPKQDVKVGNEYIVYTEKDASDLGWIVNLYDIQTKETTVLTPNTFGFEPDILENLVIWKELAVGKQIEYEYDLITKQTSLHNAKKAEIPSYDEFLSQIESTSSAEALQAIDEIIEESTQSTYVSSDEIQDELGIISEGTEPAEILE